MRAPLRILAAALLLAGAASPPVAAPERPPLTVAAAADLQGVLPEVGARFQRETGVPVVFSFGSSGGLARQIEQGAPVDLFAAASEEYVVDLERKGRIVPGSTKVYALGLLDLTIRREGSTPVRSLGDLVSPRVRRIALANPEHAPYGAAARDALRSAGLWDQLRPKLVYAENVRQAAQFVETGNADAGLVAASLVRKDGRLKSVPVPEKHYRPLRQALGIVVGSVRRTEAKRFAAFLTGPVGRTLLQDFGFRLPGR